MYYYPKSCVLLNFSNSTCFEVLFLDGLLFMCVYVNFIISHRCSYLFFIKRDNNNIIVLKIFYLQFVSTYTHSVARVPRTKLLTFRVFVWLQDNRLIILKFLKRCQKILNKYMGLEINISFGQSKTWIVVSDT